MIEKGIFPCLKRKQKNDLINLCNFQKFQQAFQTQNIQEKYFINILYILISFHFSFLVIKSIIFSKGRLSLFFSTVLRLIFFKLQILNKEAK